MESRKDARTQVRVRRGCVLRVSFFIWVFLLLVGPAAYAGPNPDVELHTRFLRHTVTLGAVEEVLITLRNTDPDQPATGIVVGGAIDSKLTLMGRTLAQGSYEVATHTWTVGTLAPNTETTLRLYLRVDTAGTYNVPYQVVAQDQTDTDSAPNNNGGNHEEDDEDLARARTDGACPAPTTELVVTTECFDNGTPDPLDDYYLATVSVAPPGLTYWVEGYTPTSRITASVTSSSAFVSPPILIGAEVDWYASVSSGGSGCYFLHTESPIACVPTQICYTAADIGNVLYRRTAHDAGWTQVGPFGVNDIEAMTYNPIADELYIVDDDQLGTVSTTTGTFSPIGTPMGIIDNNSSPVDVDDVDGISYDVFTGLLWAIEHQSGGNTVADILFQINPTTGQPVPDAFGPGIDYISLPVTIVPGTGESLLDAADVAIDPRTGKLYVIKFGLANKEYLVEYDKQTGAELNVIGNFSGLYDVEGLTFTNRDEVFVTTGDTAPTSPADYRDAIYPVNLADATLSTGTYIDFGGNSDFESVACMTEAVGTIGGTLFHDSYQNALYESGTESVDQGVTVQLYQDTNNNGLFDAGVDLLLHETTTDAAGSYSFNTAYIGDYLVRPDPATLPAGRDLTTSDSYAAKFTYAGQAATELNFGTATLCTIDVVNLTTVACDFNGTPYDPTDDRMSFELDPVATNGGSTYSVAVSSGTIAPSTAAYGTPTTFYTSGGTAGNGNVVVTVQDANAPACRATEYLIDPGTCPCPQICLPVTLTRTF